MSCVGSCCSSVKAIALSFRPWKALKGPQSRPRAAQGRELLRHCRPLWPLTPFYFLSLLLPHLWPYICMEGINMTWVGLDGEVKGSARRRKSGRTEESNQINIIIHWWGPPFTLQHTQVFYINILVKCGNRGKQSGEPYKPKFSWTKIVSDEKGNQYEKIICVGSI